MNPSFQVDKFSVNDIYQLTIKFANHINVISGGLIILIFLLNLII